MFTKSVYSIALVVLDALENRCNAVRKTAIIRNDIASPRIGMGGGPFFSGLPDFEFLDGLLSAMIASFCKKLANHYHHKGAIATIRT
jgi:hypothetical protein